LFSLSAACHRQYYDVNKIIGNLNNEPTEGYSILLERSKQYVKMLYSPYFENMTTESIEIDNSIEIIDNKYKSQSYVCTHEFPELTAVCPVTRLPDFYIMKITYEPDEKIIELKSFKLYLNKFRDREILHEEITNEILNKLIMSVNPRWANIEVKVSVRGGIYTTVTRCWSRDKGDTKC
jgi:7-cyano-7-deazaguanine reductase